MSPLISVNSISMAFGHSSLFKALTFSLFPGERVGLVGPNGAGKSTLMKILAGQMVPDQGEVVRGRGLKIGYLEQVSDFPEEILVKEVVSAGEVLSRFDLKDKEFLPVSTLSGGWKKRLALAREVAKQPDLLLLDEPTNHLDLQSILWLEKFLASCRFAVLAISHDRAFLKNFSNRIVEINRQLPMGILSVEGGYEKYCYAKESVIQGQHQIAARLKNTLRRETEWLRRGAKARTTKQQARIGRAEELKEEWKTVAERNRSQEVNLDFGGTGHAPKKLIEAKGISKAYGERLVIPPVDLLITPKTRLGILGINGSGKSTLIRLLVGVEDPDTGQIKRAEGLSVGVFEQNRDSLDPQKTLLKTLCPTGDTVIFQNRPVHIRSYLDRFLFTPQQADMQIGKLSGGEQSRVLLALLMLKSFQVLILDEPTNDLDFDTLEILQEVLDRFEGGLIVVSHDRFFLDQVCNEVLSFETAESGAPLLVPYADIWQWLEQVENRESRGSGNAQKGSVPRSETASGGRGNDKTSEKFARKLTYKEERELEAMESEIEKMDQRLHGILKQIESERNHATLQNLTQEASQIQSELDEKYVRWGELEALKKAYENSKK